MIFIDRSKYVNGSSFDEFIRHITFDDSFVGIVVDGIHCETCKIVVEIVHDMDILKNSHWDIVSTVYPLDHN